MYAQLQHQFDYLETDRKKLFEMLAKLTIEKFTQAPQPGKWSLSEILSHLITSESLTLAYLKKKYNVIDTLEDTGFSDRLRFAMFMLIQRLPLKYKAPKVVVENTPTRHTYNELYTEWESVRSEIKFFLDNMGDNNMRKKIFKHPFAGCLNILQTLVFFHGHYKHHLPQIKRVLNRP